MAFWLKFFSDRSFLVAPLLVLATLAVLWGTGRLGSAAIAVPAVIIAALVGAGIGAVSTSGEGLGEAILEDWQRWGLFVFWVAGVVTGFVAPLANWMIREPPAIPVVVSPPKEDKQQQVIEASFSAIAATFPPYGDELRQHLSKLQGLMNDLPAWFKAFDNSLKNAGDVMDSAQKRMNQPQLVKAMQTNLEMVRSRWPQMTRQVWTDRASANSKSIETINKSSLMTFTRDEIAKLKGVELLGLISNINAEINKHDYRAWAKAEVEAFETLKTKIDEDVQFLNEEASRGKAQLEKPGDLPEPAKWPEPPKGNAPSPPTSDPEVHKDPGEVAPESKRNFLDDIARLFGKDIHQDVKQQTVQQADLSSGQAPNSEELKQKARSFGTDDKFMDWLLAMQILGARADWPEEQRKRFRDDLAAEAKTRLSGNKWAMSSEIIEIRDGIKTAWQKGERDPLASLDSSTLYTGKFLSKGEFSSQEQKDALRLVIFALAQELGSTDVFQIHWINGYGRVAIRP